MRTDRFHKKAGASVDILPYKIGKRSAYIGLLSGQPDVLPLAASIGSGAGTPAPFPFTESKFTVNTNVTSTYSTANNQFKLPLFPNGSYNFVVDWGDGNTSHITTYNQADATHTYAAPGTYQIKILGKCRGWGFPSYGGPTTDAHKMLTVDTWGNSIQYTGAYFDGNAFWGPYAVCDMMTVAATDTPYLDRTADLVQFFYGCDALVSIPNLALWNTSHITNLYQMFQGCNLYNQDLLFDTSSVVNMGRMYHSCPVFNQDLGHVYVGKVESFYAMFQQASSFNNGGTDSIKNWTFQSDPLKPVNMSTMFSLCPFNQNIGQWDVSNVNNMDRMFYGASAFNNGGSATINSWDVSKVTTFYSAFESTALNQPLGNWRPSACTDFGTMFYNNKVFNQDIGYWTVGNGVSFTGMFRGSWAFNNGGTNSIQYWDVSKGTGFSRMFNDAKAFNQPLAPWNMGLATTTESMFNGALVFNQDIGGWRFPNNAITKNMFTNAAQFNNGGSNSIDGWTMGTVWDASGMFSGCTNYNQPMNSWDVHNIQWMNAMFMNCAALNQPLSSWNVSGCVNASSMFYHCTVFNQNLGAWRFNAGLTYNISLSAMFEGCTAFNNGGSNTIKDWEVSRVSDVMQMFYGCSNFNQPLTNWNTSFCTNFARTFKDATVFNQDLSSWNMSAATTLDTMFQNAIAFNNGDLTDAQSKPLTSWNLANVTNAVGVFYGCYSFNQNIGGWNLSKVTSMTTMLRDCRKFNNGGSDSIKDWVLNTTANVNGIELFRGCWSFNQPLTNWNVSKMTQMDRMFYEAVSFNQILSGWDVSLVTSMASMFQSATSFRKSLAAWSPLVCTNFSSFFASARNNDPATGFDNYDDMLISWSQKAVQTGRSFSGGLNRYTPRGLGDITGGRTRLTTATGSGGLGWTVTDSGAAAVTFDNSSGSLRVTFSTDRPTYTKVRFIPMTGAVLPTGLAANTDYWLIRLGGTTAKIATSLANAKAGTGIVYTDSGSGLFASPIRAIPFSTVNTGGLLELGFTISISTIVTSKHKVRVYNEGGALPSNLAAGVDYWYNLITSVRGNLSVSAYNNGMATYIPWVDGGTGDQFLEIV